MILEILQGKEIWKKAHGWERTAGTSTHRQSSMGHVGARGPCARWEVGEHRRVRIERQVKAKLCGPCTLDFNVTENLFWRRQ